MEYTVSQWGFSLHNRAASVAMVGQLAHALPGEEGGEARLACDTHILSRGIVPLSHCYPSYS